MDWNRNIVFYSFKFGCDAVYIKFEFTWNVITFWNLYNNMFYNLFCAGASQSACGDRLDDMGDMQWSVDDESYRESRRTVFGYFERDTLCNRHVARKNHLIFMLRVNKEGFRC